MATRSDKFGELAAALKEARALSPREPRKRHGAIREAVAANLDELLAMRGEGFSDGEIADIFRSKGLAVAAGTLKTYVNALRAERNGTKQSSNGAKARSVTKAETAGKRVGKTTTTVPPVTQAAGKPSELASRPAAKGSSTTANNPFSHRLDDSDV